MRYYLLATLGVAVLFGSAYAAPAPKSTGQDLNSHDALPLVPTIFNVEVIPGEGEITFNGTLEEVLSEILEINPAFQLEPATLEDDSPATSKVTPDDTAPRVRRYFKGRPYCWVANFPYEQADYNNMKNYMIPLLMSAGMVSVSVPARSCSTILYKAADSIELCNWRYRPLTGILLRRVAHAANEITVDCTRPSNENAQGRPIVAGWWEDTTSYAVKVCRPLIFGGRCS